MEPQPNQTPAVNLPPESAADKTTQTPQSSGFKAEVVNQIPVKSPSAPLPYAKTKLPPLEKAEPMTQPLGRGAKDQPDPELGPDLGHQAGPDKKTASPMVPIASGVDQKSTAKAAKASPPILATIVALAVATCLCLAALKYLK